MAGNVGSIFRPLPFGYMPARFVELRDALTTRALTDAELAEVGQIGIGLVTQNMVSYNAKEKHAELQSLLAVQACLRSAKPPAGSTLNERLGKLSGAISDAALLMEAELNAATDRDAIKSIELYATNSRLLLEHVQTAAWEKAKAIRVAETVSAIIEG